MSRTYRRRTEKPPYWMTHKLTTWRTKSGGFAHKWVPLSGKELEKGKAMYHSDMLVTMNQGDTWIKRNKNRKFRRVSKQTLSSFTGDYEELMMPVYKNSVLWETW